MFLHDAVCTLLTLLLSPCTYLKSLFTCLFHLTVKFLSVGIMFYAYTKKVHGKWVWCEWENESVCQAVNPDGNNENMDSNDDTKNWKKGMDVKYREEELRKGKVSRVEEVPNSDVCKASSWAKGSVRAAVVASGCSARDTSWGKLAGVLLHKLNKSWKTGCQKSSSQRKSLKCACFYLAFTAPQPISWKSDFR